MQPDKDDARAELERLLDAQKHADAEMAKRAKDPDTSWREEWIASDKTRKLRMHELHEVLGITPPA